MAHHSEMKLLIVWRASFAQLHTVQSPYRDMKMERTYRANIPVGEYGRI